jgi:glycosyltransferase involved in cell wall biosynthesis
MYYFFVVKRIIENIFIFPFVILGRMYAAQRPLNKEYDIFLFFPFYHIGGAEKVHYLIAQAVGSANCVIFFTRKSDNDLYYDEFARSGCVIHDISAYTDNKFRYYNNLIHRGIISGYIKRQRKKPVVFNGQSNFGYKISPWISSTIRQFELIHSYSSFSWIRVPFIQYYVKTIMISKVRINDHLEQYKRLKIPARYNKNILYVINGIQLPEISPVKNPRAVPLEVIYVGRGTEEKRVHLIAMAAKMCHQKKLEVKISFIGEVKYAIPEELHQYCTFYGNISDASALNLIYERSHVLLMTSTTEGFPMAVMEGMAYGLAIISTDVGDIPVHVLHETNGFLISQKSSDNEIVQEAVSYIEKLLLNRDLLRSIEDNNIAYAKAHFGLEQFNRTYQELLKEK